MKHFLIDSLDEAHDCIKAVSNYILISFHRLKVLTQKVDKSHYNVDFWVSLVEASHSCDCLLETEHITSESSECVKDPTFVLIHF